MTRNEEYQALLQELETTPAALDGAVERALRRRKRDRRLRLFGVPAGSLAACFAAFVLLVNLFPPFARACGSVPVLRELAQAVAWSPSLSAAVENDYVQPIGQSQTVNGVTATVEYVIVDRKQLNIFYTLDYAPDLGPMWADCRITPGDGSAGDAGGRTEKPGELVEIKRDFVDRDVPGILDLTLSVYPAEQDGGGPPAENTGDGYFDQPVDDQPAYLAEMTFHLEFDPYFTAQGTLLELNRTFALDGQTFTLQEAEIYPTHLRLTLTADPDNTAWLKSLRFYIEDETGRRNEAISNGISATGTTDTPFMGSMHQESTFFWQSEHLTLHITGAEWLDKDLENVKVDLNTGAHGWLPEGVGLTVERRADRAYFTVKAPQLEQGHYYQVMSWEYLDPEGNTHTMDSRSSNTTGPLGEETPGFFYEEFSIPVHDWDCVWLKLTSTRQTSFDTPVSIPLS